MMASEERQVPVKRVKSTHQNQKFVCNNKFEAVAGQGHDKKTHQERKRVMFDCDSEESTSRVGEKNRTEVRMGQKTRKNAEMSRTSWGFC